MAKKPNPLDSYRYKSASPFYLSDTQKLRKDQRRYLRIAELQERDQALACNRHIFLRRDENLREHEQRIEIRIGQNYCNIKTPCVGEQGGTGGRGKVTYFSKASSRRLKREFASLEHYPRVWLDFTFADDVMAGKTPTERAEFSSWCIETWKRKADRIVPDFWGYWKREWKRRKSGDLLGELCPHIHGMLDHESITEENYQQVCIELALLWVGITGTSDSNAVRVAIQPPRDNRGGAYRWITSTKQAQFYVSEYMAKEDKQDGEESLGRFWGRFGRPKKAEETVEVISPHEYKSLKRLLAQTIRCAPGSKPGTVKRVRRFQDRYKRNGYGDIFVSRETVQRMLAWIRSQESCPF